MSETNLVYPDEFRDSVNYVLVLEKEVNMRYGAHLKILALQIPTDTYSCPWFIDDRYAYADYVESALRMRCEVVHRTEVYGDIRYFDCSGLDLLPETPKYVNFGSLLGEINERKPYSTACTPITGHCCNYYNAILKEILRRRLSEQEQEPWTYERYLHKLRVESLVNQQGAAPWQSRL